MMFISYLLSIILLNYVFFEIFYHAVYWVTLTQHGV